jgi:hypothetical protein
MIPIHGDLRDVIEAVQIESPSSYRIRTTARILPSESQDPSPDGYSRVRIKVLADDIYSTLYCARGAAEPSARVADWLAVRDYLRAVAAANQGRGNWEPGWELTRVDGVDTIVARKNGVEFRVTPADVQPSAGSLAPGTPCRVRVPHELRHLVPGFYMALGNADPLEGEYMSGNSTEASQFRLYWHLTAEGAAPFIAATTSALNAAGIPFQVKVLSDPGDYTRADAGVLYLSSGDAARAAAIVPTIHAAVAPWLRETVPLFVRQIAPGLGYAQSPPGPMSFGQHRCRLIASALWDSFDRGGSDDDARIKSVADAFQAAGLDPLQPHREPGSCDDPDFDFPEVASPRVSVERETTGSATDRAEHAHRALIEAASQIGAELCRSAHWDGSGHYCNWMGRSMTAERKRPGGPITPTSSALGPELYSGASGIALFLAQLFRATGAIEQRRTALAAVAGALRQLEALPSGDERPALSLYFGPLGVAWAARRVAALLEDDAIEAAASAALARVTRARPKDARLDMMSGCAGAIPILLDLERGTGQAGFGQLARDLGSELCQTAICDGDTCRWPPERASGPGITTVPLGGLSHGASGMGLALFELYAATGRADFLETARGAFAFEDSLYDASRKNWRDLRDSETENRFACAWCHGAPGIAIAALRAAEIDQERRATYRRTAEIALATTLDAIDQNIAATRLDASLCHGLAGLGEIALSVGRSLADPSGPARSHQLAIALIERHGLTHSWPSGVPSRGPNPSLFLGLAGIGYWLLRLHDPEAVPSLLARNS